MSDYIVSAIPGNYVIDIPGGNANRGQALQVYPQNVPYTDSQNWTTVQFSSFLDPGGSWSFIASHQNPNLVLDIKGGEGGHIVHLWPKKAHNDLSVNNQLWRFENGRLVTRLDYSSGKKLVLDVPNSNPSLGLQVYPESSNLTVNQSFGLGNFSIHFSYDIRVAFSAFDKGNGNVEHAGEGNIFALYLVQRITNPGPYDFTVTVNQFRALSFGDPPYLPWGNTPLATYGLPAGLLAPGNMQVKVKAKSHNDEGFYMLFNVRPQSASNLFVPLDYPGPFYNDSTFAVPNTATTLDANSIQKYFA